MFLFIRSSTNPGPRVSRIISFFKKHNKEIIYLSPIRKGDIQNNNYRKFGNLGEYDYFDGSGFLKYLIFLISINLRIAKEIFFNRKKIKMIHFSDLEVVLFGGILCKVLKIDYIYNIHDNFYQRYEFNSLLSISLKYIETGYILLSQFTLVPESFRKKAYPKISHHKINILRNFPDFDVSNKYTPFQSNKIKMFYGGWISKNRNIEQYFDLANELKSNGLKVEFRCCGWGDEDYLDNLNRTFLENDIGFEYLGQLNQVESIKILEESDLAIAFYSPDKIINILAASNKIPEIIGSSTILITNSQSEIAKNIKQKKISLQFNNQIKEVLPDLLELIKNKDETIKFVNRSKDFYLKEYSPKIMSKSLNKIFDYYL